MTETRFLASVDPGSWQAATASLHCDHWLWCDQTGLHQASQLPAQEPMTTHIWGWSPDRWYRLRVDPDIDGGHVCGALLETAASDPARAREVCVTIDDVDTWPPGDHRAGLPPGTPRGLTARTLTVVVPPRGNSAAASSTLSTLTFVELDDLRVAESSIAESTAT